MGAGGVFLSAVLGVPVVLRDPTVVEGLLAAGTGLAISAVAALTTTPTLAAVAAFAVRCAPPFGATVSVALGAAGFLSIGGCSPLAPSAAVWVLSGQSNAREVRPALNTEAARAGAVVTGWAEGGDGIGNWGPTTAGWIGWIDPALRQPGVVAFAWLQGEYEATSPAAVAIYGAQLTDLMARVRAAAGNPHLRVIVSEVSMRADYAGMRDVQKAYVVSDPDARLVNTEDLADNGGHFFPDGYLAIAHRIALAVP